MLLLTIETSCDETAAAVVRDGRQVLSSIVASQVAVHAAYGGVVPEIASRHHIEAISIVIDQALEKASVSLAEIEGIAFTQGPGLAGALLVGIAMAKGIAYARGIPFVGVNHIEGHLLAIFLEREVDFPFLALVVSGGHTHLYRVDGIGRYKTLGQTIDDAAGEAYDKIAKVIGIPYPGGAEVDLRAGKGCPTGIKLPRPLLHDGTLNFSFSGLKTAFFQLITAMPQPLSEARKNDMCASFQEAVCDVIVSKCAAAMELTGIRTVVVAGGVACNSGLRREMARLADRKGGDIHFPKPALCADNAAMLAVPGDFYLTSGKRSGVNLDALPIWPLDSISAQLK